jgi:hypothetical protein
MMLRSRPRFTLRQAMIAIAVIGVASWAFARYTRWTYYDTGWWEAEGQLWRGDVTIYGSAGLMRGDICLIDRKTGLPVDWPGCMSDASYDERMAGHNDHIAQFIRSHGLPRNSLKPWENELFNLARFFDERSQIDVPKRLVADGPAVVSPDGLNRVRLVRDAAVTDLLSVVITAGDDVAASSPADTGNGATELLWGPQGSRVAVIRSMTDTGERLQAYDLRTGRHLRDESRDKEKWSGLRALGKTLATLRSVR